MSKAFRWNAEPRNPNSQPAVRRRALYVLIVLLAAVTGAALGHPLLLRAMARTLVVDQPGAEASAVWVRAESEPYEDGDGCLDRAAEWYRQGARRRLVVVHARPGRVVRMGVLPGFEEIARQQLVRAGVPAEAVSFGGRPRTPYAEARLLAAWLDEHPGSSALWLCDRFDSRHWRYVFDRVLEPSAASRVHVSGQRDRRFDETNWWRSRAGAKRFFNATVRLLYARFVPGCDAPSIDHRIPAS